MPPASFQHQAEAEPHGAAQLPAWFSSASNSSSEPLPTLRPHSPLLTAQRTQLARVQRYSPLALWHLLSLDAPTVAALWTLFIARSFHLELPFTSPAAMFVAVWMIYATDRLFDARMLDLDLPRNILDVRLLDMRDRHYFHHRHRTIFLLLILLAALLLAFLLCTLDPRSLHIYAVLATLLAAWMLLIHAQPLLASASSRPHLRLLPKELAVGIFFPAAVFIPTLARTAPTPQATHLLGWAATWLRPSLLPSATLFGCVCTLNCLYLCAWEHSPPHPSATLDAAASSLSAQPEPTLPSHWSTQWGARHLKLLTGIAIALSTLTAAGYLGFAPVGIQAAGLPALACGLSVSALLILDRLRGKLSPIHLRGAADLALLTPLLLLPFTR